MDTILSKILLIPNPNLELSKGKLVPEPYIPLGLISIATILSENDIDVEILDINRLAKDTTYQNIPDEILSRTPQIVGFSAMCNQYPSILNLARRCKELNPAIVVILGGPEPTIVDRETMKAFPFVDLIVRGECELNIVRIIRALINESPTSDLPGITYRNNGQVNRNPSLPPIMDLDLLPLPDYELVPNINSFKTAFLEVGRGCPYECTFCSTKDFWQRKFRLRSTKKIIELIKNLQSKYMFKNYSFQHDNLTVSKKRIRELCEGLQKENLKIAWSCSTRIDCLDDNIVDWISNAGCNKIFLGVESGSPRMQKIIKKKLDLSKAGKVVRSLTSHGISATASFIIGFPDEHLNDIRHTINLMLELRYIVKDKSILQLHMLAPTPGTTLHEKYKSTLNFDDNYSDMATSRPSKSDYQLIRDYPDIFSAFYYYDTPHVDRNTLLKINYLMINIQFLPFTLFVLWKNKNFDFPDCYIDHLELLNMPGSAWERSDGVGNLSAISKFIKQILRHQRVKDHYIYDLLKYELIASQIFNEDNPKAGSVISDNFNYDVESILESIRASRYTNAPEFAERDNHYLLFTKRDGKSFTIRLHEKLARVFSPRIP
jgi:radical SAM superfamily enzyme YgiQ (UPF0313 family)